VEPGHALTHFGFTALEAEIYAYLLTDSPVSGYRIAQAIHKPAANTYKALQTLEFKGAVFAEDGTTKQYVPIPKAELLARVTRDFERRRRALVEALPDGPAASATAAPFILQGPNVLDRAIALTDEATRVLVGMVGGPAAIALAAPLAAAPDRDVEVAVIPVPQDRIVLVGDRAAALIGTSTRALWTTDPSLILPLVQLTASLVGYTEVAEREDVGAKRLQRIVARVDDLISDRNRDLV